MKQLLSLGSFMLLCVGLLLIVSCQTKEVTSAKVYIQQDDWDKAVEQLEVAVKLYPNDPEAHYLLAQGYGKKGLFPEMVREMDASLAAGPTFEADISKLRQYYWGTSFNTGIKRHKENDTDAAIQYFQTSIMIDSTRAEGYKNLAIMYTNQGKTEDALKVYETLLKYQSNDVAVYRQLSQVRRELKDYDGAIDALKKAIEIDPSDNVSLSNLAITYDMAGKKDEAFKMYEEALSKDPENTDLMFNYGQLHFGNGNFEKAIALFDKVIAASPDDYDSNLRVGYAYLGMADEFLNQLKEGEEGGKEITEEDRETHKGFFCKSVPYLEKATKAIDADPSISSDPSKVWHFLGVAYINCGQKEKGEAAFAKEDELK